MRNPYKKGFFILLILIIATGAYYLGRKQIGLFGNVTQAPTPTDAPIFPTRPDEESVKPAQGTPTLTRDDIEAQIIAAIGNKAYADLSDIMNDNVMVILEATECCGMMPKIDALSQMTYLRDATPPWDFTKDSTIADALRREAPAKYGPSDSIIGISSDDYVVAFQLDEKGKIEGITMAVTYELIVQ